MVAEKLSRDNGGEQEPEHEIASLEEAIAVIEALKGALREKEAALEEAQENATKDTLLESMLNQGAAKRELEKRVEEGRAFGVFIVDIDKFKPYNDTYGHDEGDELLLLLEELLQKYFRREDDNCVLARIGGDEFLLIMIDLIQNGRRTSDPHQQMENIREIVLRQGVEAELLERQPRARALGVGLSVGGAIFDPQDPVSAKELKREADAALYVDKRRRHGSESSR